MVLCTRKERYEAYWMQATLQRPHPIAYSERLGRSLGQTKFAVYHDSLDKTTRQMIWVLGFCLDACQSRRVKV